MNTPKLLTIRFNTGHNGSLHWRMIIEEKESLADHVIINVSTFDMKDILTDGKMKFHFSCHCTELKWIGTSLTVR